MIKTDATTKSIEIKLAGAVTTNELPFVASYSDISQTTFELTGAGAADGLSNGGTAVTVAAAPAASTTRKLDYLSIVNIDTAAVTLTVQYNNNGTRRTILKIALAIGDQLSFTDANGWTVFDASGAEKFTSSIGANTITLAMLAQIGTASVLGRNTAGTGNVEVLTTLPNGVQDNITRLGTITVAGNVALLNAANHFTASGATQFDGYFKASAGNGFLVNNSADTANLFELTNAGVLNFYGNSVSVKATISSDGILSLKYPYGPIVSGGASGSPFASFGANYYNDGAARSRVDTGKAGLMLEIDPTDSLYVKYITSGGSASDLLRLTNAGILTVKGFGAHSFVAGGNGLNSVNVENTTAGTAAGSRISLLIEGSATRLILDAYSDSYTTSGAQIAGGALVGGLGAGGVSLLANHASGDIRGYVGGANLKFKIQASDGHTYTDNGSVSSLSDVRTKRKVGEFTAGLAAIQGIVSGDLQRWMHNKMDVTVRGKRVQIPRSSRPFVGASAQTIKQFVPEAVHEDPETGLLAVDTAPIWWAGMRAIKELADRVAALEAA